MLELKPLPPHSLPPEYAAWEKAALSQLQTDQFCCTPAWQLAFHDAFSPKRRVLIHADGGSAIALAETSFGPGRVFITPVEASWFFGCPLLGRGAVELFVEALAYFYREYYPLYPNIIISGIRPRGVLGKRLLAATGKSFNIYLKYEGIQASASLVGGVDGYLSRRSGNHRSKLRRAVKKAARHGITFERVAPQSIAEARASFERIIAVELTSWKGIGHCGMAEGEVKDFYRCLLERVATTNSGRVIFARYQGKDIGFIFGCLAGKVYRGQQFSYAAEWSEFSLGNLMQFEKINWLCEQGITRYDMGPLDGPKMEYKHHWAEKATPYHIWRFEKAF